MKKEKAMKKMKLSLNLRTSRFSLHRARVTAAIKKQRHALLRLKKSARRNAVASAPAQTAGGITMHQTTIVNGHKHTATHAH